MATRTDRAAGRTTTTDPGPGLLGSLGLGSLPGMLMWLTDTGDDVRELALGAVAGLGKTVLRWLFGG